MIRLQPLASANAPWTNTTVFCGVCCAAATAAKTIRMKKDLNIFIPPKKKSAKRFEGRAHLGDEELGLLPGSEVAALGELVVVDELRVRPLRPSLRSGVDLLGKDAHADGDLDTPGVEEAALRHPPEFPVEPGRGDRGVREPVVRDVVEDVVTGEALRLAVETAGDYVVTLRVMVENPGRQA